MKVVKRLGTVVLSIVLWIVILVAALYAFTTMATRDNQNVANILGYTPLVVKSDSMAPTFSAGDLIFIKKCDTSALEEGDIICFHTIIENEYALNTHRIKSIETVGDARSYTTVGDNNNGVADLHVISDGDIVGKYVGHLQGVGRVMDFLSSSTGFLIVIVLPMLLFFIYQVYHLIMISIRLKKAVAVETAREVEAAKMQAMNGAAKPNAESAADVKQNAAPVNTDMMQNTEAAPVNADQMSDPAVSAKTEAQRAKEEAQAALAEAQKIREEAEAIKAQAEAEAALAEAKRLREEAEAMKAQAQAELEKAKQETTKEASKAGAAETVQADGSGEDKKA